MVYGYMSNIGGRAYILLRQWTQVRDFITWKWYFFIMNESNVCMNLCYELPKLPKVLVLVVSKRIHLIVSNDKILFIYNHSILTDTHTFVSIFVYDTRTKY